MAAEPPVSRSDPAAYIPLPTGLADPRAMAGRVFDRIAALYDRARPGYPPEAIDEMLKICGGTTSSRVLEIGCGTGQLTRDLATTGAAILALEPGGSLADLGRANLAGYPNVEVVTATFEEFNPSDTTYQLVVSATAFHWIDPGISYARAAGLLDSEGWLALMTNAHAVGGSHTSEPFATRLREIHRGIAPEVGDWSFPTAEEIAKRAAGGGDIATVWSRIERKVSDPPDVSEMFAPPKIKTYPWLASYDRVGFLDMLASQSSYALLDPERRDELLSGIGRLVDDLLGGAVTKEYVTVVAAAQRSPRP